MTVYYFGLARPKDSLMVYSSCYYEEYRSASKLKIFVYYPQPTSCSNHLVMIDQNRFYFNESVIYMNMEIFRKISLI
jgi:hypothetical protein